MNFLQLKSLWKKICANSEIIGVDVDCPNKDGITPMYQYISEDGLRDILK